MTQKNDKNCIENDCCTISMLSDINNARCNLINKKIYRKKFVLLESLFKLSNNSMIEFSFCQILYFNSINITNGYSSLISNNDFSSNFIGNISILNSKIFRSYFNLGIVYVINKDINMHFKNSMISEYNHFNFLEYLNLENTQIKHIITILGMLKSKSFLVFSKVIINILSNFIYLKQCSIIIDDINLTYQKNFTYLDEFTSLIIQKAEIFSNPLLGNFIYSNMNNRIEIINVAFKIFGNIMIFNKNNIVNITKCIFQNSAKDQDQSALKFYNSNIINLNNVSIFNLYAYLGSFASFYIGNKILLISLKFENGTAYNGGGFYLEKDNIFIMQECSFKNISAIKNGGLFNFKENNSFKINYTNFNNIKSLKSNGGVFYFTNKNNININNSVNLSTVMLKK